MMFFKKLFAKKSKNLSLIESDNKDQYEEVSFLIEKELKHFIKSHNGKIKLHAVKENIVYISLTGSCSSCPAIEITLNGFINRVFREKLVWFEKVILVK